MHQSQLPRKPITEDDASLLARGRAWVRALGEALVSREVLEQWAREAEREQMARKALAVQEAHAELARSQLADPQHQDQTRHQRRTYPWSTTVSQTKYKEKPVHGSYN